MFKSYGAGRYSPGENDWLLAPRTYKADGDIPGLVYCHGSGQSTAGLAAAVTGAEYDLVQALGDAFPTAVCDLGGISTWGNATARARIGAAKAWLQGAWGARPGPVLLVGYSMGGLAALNYTQANPASVAAVAGFMPVTDLAEMYTNNRGGYQTSIGTAWGVTSPTPLPAGASPHDSYTRSTPLAFWTASDDTIARPAPAAALAAAVGGAAHNIGAHGHGGHAHIPVADVVAFLSAAT